jgi:SAM-dependent methyltransferase
VGECSEMSLERGIGRADGMPAGVSLPSDYDRAALPDASFSRASSIAWEEYYRAIEGRPVRPLFLEAIELLPTREDTDHALIAIDLGCGDGTETRSLLARGWTVIAADAAAEAVTRLLAAVTPETATRLTTHVAPFHELELPDGDFVYAGLSLPFCAPHEFDETWPRIERALRPEGVFAGHFFGPHDSWASTPGMTFHTRQDLDGLLARFNVRVLREEDEDGQAVSGPKHWHVFHVIASKRSSG